jgi:hypothetical protein
MFRCLVISCAVSHWSIDVSFSMATMGSIVALMVSSAADELAIALNFTQPLS